MSRNIYSNNPLISIIIPVYNVEKFIGKCLESCLSQSFNNIEIIIINDGSIDFSGEIINYFANKDSRIKVINQSNSGVSASRNIGLKEAQGKYIMFIDGDDYIEPNTLQDIYNIIESTKSDVCIFNFQIVFWEQGKKYIKKMPNLLDFQGRLYDIKPDFFNYMTVVWGKLFRNNELLPSFNEQLKKAEDGAFLWEYYLKNPKVVFTNKYLYSYVQHVNSTVRQKSLVANCDIIKSAEYVSKLPLFGHISTQFQNNIINRYSLSIIYEIERFFNGKKWPKLYKRQVYDFLVSNYNKEIAKMQYYQQLTGLYIEQQFYFFKKIFSVKIVNNIKTITFFFIKFTKKLPIDKLEQEYITKLKKNIKKYKQNTYLLADCLYENAECIDAYSLFLKMREQGLKAYYILLKQNPLYEQLLNSGQMENIIVLPNTLDKICFYAHFYDILLKTKSIIVSYELKTYDRKFLVNNSYWKYIFIQHGPTFLKESVLKNGYLTPAKYDKVLISSEKEERLLKKYNFDDNKLIKIGLPRYDLLPTQSMKHNKILVMFTWRQYHNDDFNKSIYKKKILELLNNRDLDEYLKAKGIKLYFALHHALLELNNINFDINYKNIVSIDKISKYIKECSLLITDFSSIAFDFMYQNKPVLFWMLDYNDPVLSKLDKENMERMNYKKYLVGNVYYKLSSVLNKLKYYIEHHFVLENDTQNLYKNFFYEKKNIRQKLIRELEHI
ncbi:MAG: glycosyltransferase [Alphaproteobacteria bacterium]|nr:glycosyltransferase [Alphaproteobacteria bacterium]